MGHIFKLGTKYSDAMHAVYLDENGKENVMIMGCYGIGISRVVASAIQQNHDRHGIIFPPTVAPVECILLNLDPGKEEVRAKAEEIYAMLCKAGVTVLLDDREERPGVKFKDADLIGAPMQLVLGGETVPRRAGMQGPPYGRKGRAARGCPGDCAAPVDGRRAQGLGRAPRLGRLTAEPLHARCV